MSKYKLGEVCEFINGGAWSDKEYVLSGIPVLKVSNCKKSGFTLDEIDYLPEESRDKYSKNELKLGDVIIATVGSHPNLKESAAGRSCVVNGSVEGFFLNQNAVCIRTTNPEIVDQKYLGYLAASFPFQHYIQMRGRGAANQMRIAIGSIKEYEHSFPDIRTQQRIARIISAYDELIENNQKQIKLLEEAAQRLYKEWFIDLHFPGHETTPIVDGVPQGWAVGTLGDIAEFKRGKMITKKQATEGDVPVVAGGKEPAYMHDKANTKAPVITVSASGNAGFTKMYYQNVWASDCSFLDITASENMYFSYLYLLYRQDDIYSMQKGSCQQHITAKEINAMKTLIPPEDVLASFTMVISGFFSKISVLEKQVRNATQARNRLLPKLMSGEIEV